MALYRILDPFWTRFPWPRGAAGEKVDDIRRQPLGLAHPNVWTVPYADFVLCA